MGPQWGSLLLSPPHSLTLEGRSYGKDGQGGNLESEFLLRICRDWLGASNNHTDISVLTFSAVTWVQQLHGVVFWGEYVRH